MGMRWKFALPVVALIVFAGISWDSYRNPREGKAAVERYFYVGSVIRLDSHPRPERPPDPCDETKGPCVTWDMSEAGLWHHPGMLQRILAFCSLPALFIGLFITAVLGKYGMNQLLVYMISMPPLIFGWFYFIGCSLAVGVISVPTNRRPFVCEKKFKYDFHISEISTNEKVLGVVDGFCMRSYNVLVKAFDSSES
jgi:hypothetical protein